MRQSEVFFLLPSNLLNSTLKLLLQLGIQANVEHVKRSFEKGIP